MIQEIFSLLILIVSVIIHEVAHGYAALYFGDQTAYRMGRLTLNPVKHIDLFGSIILPALTLLASKGSIFFGFAKPVPYNPNNLRRKRLGEFVVSIAGVFANFFVAFVFAMIARTMVNTLPESFVSFAVSIVYVNIMLGVFNLIPIPPLDGSKILFTLLPQTMKMRELQNMFEKYALVFLFLLVFVGWNYLSLVVPIIFQFFLGI